MANKALVPLFLIAISAFSVAERGEMRKRQTFPEQFSQLTDKFHESFNPSGGNFPTPQFQLGQFPSGFPNFPQRTRKQLDASQFSQLTNHFQEAFKPFTENSPFGFGGYPTGNSPGSGGFLGGQTKRMTDVSKMPVADEFHGNAAKVHSN